jgi:hypothetical protein
MIWLKWGCEWQPFGPCSTLQSLWQRLCYQKGGSTAMDISRKLGILVFFAVPAIIGGGIVFGLSGSWMYVFIYEIILLLVAGGFVAK